MQLQIATSCFARLKERRRNMAGRTGCGLCGTESLDQALRPPPQVTSRQGFSAHAVSLALGNMRQRQQLLQLTGATHAAAWCNTEGDIVLIREDVGRHNALDKLIGALLRSQLSAEQGFVALTSRASYEMVHKAACAGIGLVAAVSGVTGLAIDTAQVANLTLLGFARGQNASVYTHSWRFQFDSS